MALSTPFAKKSITRPLFVKVLQKEFSNSVLLTSLALCYKETERELAVEQIVARNLAPIERFSKVCISKLLLAGLITCRTVGSALVGSSANTRQLIAIEKFGAIDSPMHEVISESIQTLRNNLETDSDCVSYLDLINLEIRSCECIQYIHFFAARDNLRVLDASSSNSNLHLLLQENIREQVFMLLWRSVKKHAGSNSLSTKDVGFADLIQTAMEYYFIYQARESAIDLYPWPKQLGVSKLAHVVHLLKKS